METNPFRVDSTQCSGLAFREKRERIEGDKLLCMVEIELQLTKQAVSDLEHDKRELEGEVNRKDKDMISSRLCSRSLKLKTYCLLSIVY